MRGIIFLIIIALFYLPVLANQEDEGILPFAYVTMQEYTETNWANYDLHLMNALNGENLFSLTTEENECPNTISPDGEWLSFTRGSIRDSSLYLLNIATGEERQISNQPSGISQVVWSENNRWLAYQRRLDNRNQLFAYDVLEQREYYVDDAPLNPPQWYGEVLVYATIEDEMLIIHDWNQQELRSAQYLIAPKQLNWLSFSPNRNAFLLLTMDNSETRLFLYEAGSEQATDIGQIQFSALLWLADGFQFIYSQSAYSALYIYDIRTHTNEIFAPQERTYSALSLSPNGQNLLYREYHAGGTFNNAYSFSFINIETRQETGMVSWVDYYNQSGAFTWLSDNQVIYSYTYSENDINDPDINDIYRYDMSSRESIQLTNTPEVHEMFYCEWG